MAKRMKCPILCYADVPQIDKTTGLYMVNDTFYEQDRVMSPRRFLTAVLLHPLEEKVHHRIMSLSFHVKLYIIMYMSCSSLSSELLLCFKFRCFFCGACMASMNND